MSREDNWGKPEIVSYGPPRRYNFTGEPKVNYLNPLLQAPNALQILLEDDELASSCKTVTQYRHALGLLLKNQFAGAPAAVGATHTPGRITAPITASGRAFGLIPEGKGWANDLINWDTREFRNPADAVRLGVCWNAFVGLETAYISAVFAMTKKEGISLLTAAVDVSENRLEVAVEDWTNAAAPRATIDDTTYGN